MVTRHGIQLAGHLISSFYGDLCSKVCVCLLNRGTLTIALIVRYTELTREHVINCLRVLIHQNCVQGFAIQEEGGFGDAPKVATQYMALFDNIIHKLRAAKLVQIVSEELGDDCLGIFQGLLEHGRLSINQIIDRNQQTPGSSDVNAVRENFTKLVTARFVERCPAPEPYLAPSSEEEGASKKKGAKSKGAIQQQTREQRILEAARPMDSMRFLMEMDDFSEKKDEETPKSVKTGEKRKQDALKLDEDVLGANNKKEALWRVNFEELARRLQHKACVLYVKTRINDEAGIVLSAVLELSRRSDNRLKGGNSACFAINVIYDEVIKKEGGLGMDLERIRASLEQLGCQSDPDDIDETYSVDIKSIIEMAQIEEVESLILQRYGREAFRIFGLLFKAGRVLETDKIADSTFVNMKDATMILYKLWKDDYLHMEKVATSAAKNSMYMLWKINKPRVQEQFLDEMYHAALNLRLRIAYELDQGKELLQLPREKLVGELEKKFRRLGKVRVVLESSLMNLDDAILLFHI